MFKSKMKGFSLLELVVVLAVMGTLAAVAVPAYNAVTDNSSAGALISSADGLAKSGTGIAQSDVSDPGRGVSILDIDISQADDAVLSNGVVTVFGQKDQCITISVSGSNSDAEFVVSDVKDSSNVTSANGRVTGGQCDATVSSTPPTTNASVSDGGSPATTVAPTTTTTVALTCAQGGTCAVGDVGPGGGRVFITPATSGNATGLYFEAAPFADEVQATWCSNTTTLLGASGTAIGTGQSNTTTAYATCTSGAIDIADDYSNNGFSDWFLPSKDEHSAMYAARNSLGGFSTDRYWSSSENFADGAWVQNFLNGLQGTGSKLITLYVRPVRAFN